MSQLALNVRHSSEEQTRRLTSLREAAEERFEFQVDLLADLRVLFNFGQEIVDFAHEYDFKNVQANGYRSLLELGFKLIRFGLEGASHDDNGSFIDDFARAVEQFAHGANLLRKIRTDTKFLLAGDGRCPLQTTDEFYGVQLFFRYINNHDSEPFYGQLLEFPFEGPLFRTAASMFIRTVCAVFAKNPFDALVTLSSRSRVATAYSNRIKNADVYMVKILDNLFFRNIINERFVPFLVHGLKPKVQETLYIERQRRWLLVCDSHAQSVTIEDNLTGDIPLPEMAQAKVRCRLLCEPDPVTGQRSPSGHLLLSLHGGGFATSKSEGHEIYLRRWMNKLPGVAMLSVDYSLSPETLFPTAHQEALDVYLWLVSGHSSVENTLGFIPQNIVLVGDSSGANFSLSLTTMLNDIKKKEMDAIRLMPAAIVGVYPSFICDPFIYPSMFLSASHWILTPALFASFVECYVPHNFEYDSDCSHYNRAHVLDNGILYSVKYFFMWLLGLHTPLKPWYKSGRAEAIENCLVRAKLLRHHYISPARYQDLESLRNMKMYLIACSNDPVLDQSVIMSRRWKGQVNLDVLDALSHGFLFSANQGQICSEAADFCLMRIKQALGLLKDEMKEQRSQTSFYDGA